MRTQLRALRACAVFLTRLRLGGFPYSDAEWRWAAAYFPVVGAAIGALLSAALHATQALGAAPAAVLCVSAGLWLTGALHEDGLADTADALGAAPRSGERLREILKDSAVGTYGTLALFVSLFLRVSLLIELAESAAVALILSHSLARVAPVWLLASMNYVSDPATSRSGALASAVGLPQALAAIAFAGALCVWAIAMTATPVSAIALCAATLSGIGIAGRVWFSRALGGVTGDFLGALEQVSECGVLLSLALILHT